ALGLYDPALMVAIGRAVGDVAEDPLLLLGACPQARLLLVVDRLALDLVDDLVKGRLVADPDGVAPQRASVDDEGHLGDVGVRRAPMHLVRELDDRVRSVVEEPFETMELALGVGADSVGDLDVLALHDRPHAVTSGLSGRYPSIAAGVGPADVSAPSRPSRRTHRRHLRHRAPWRTRPASTRWSRHRR